MVTLENVLVDGTGARTAEGNALYDFATEVLNFIVNVFYTVALFVKDFIVDHTMWFIFLMILGGLYAYFRRKGRRIGM